MVGVTLKNNNNDKVNTFISLCLFSPFLFFVAVVSPSLSHTCMVCKLISFFYLPSFSVLTYNTHFLLLRMKLRPTKNALL